LGGGAPPRDDRRRLSFAIAGHGGFVENAFLKRRSRMKDAAVDFVHVGPGTLAGRYLRRVWQPIELAAELKPGFPKCVEIMGEHFTLFRGESGAPHLLQDRCPHRNTRLSLGWIEQDCIRCLYHGWKFDGEGNCVEQPAEDEAFRHKVVIRAYPAREYLGLVFAYLGEGAAPEFPRYPELEAESGGFVLAAHKRNVPYNWFQRIENSMDDVHVNFVHKVSADDVPEMRQVPKIFRAEETEYGILWQVTYEKGEEMIPHLAHFLMPNGSIRIVPPNTKDDAFAVHLTWRVPINDEATITLTASREKPRRRVKPDAEYPDADEIVRAILDGKMRLQDVDRNHPLLFIIQDNTAMSGQGRIYDRGNERLGRSDIGVILLRRLYERELRALATAKPLKDWKRPEAKFLIGFRTEAAA
jgi:5,5'-dehydrodivanillate O-demethylase oxygenase subunit